MLFGTGIFKIFAKDFKIACPLPLISNSKISGCLDLAINLLQILLSITLNSLLSQKGKFTLHLVVLIDGLEGKYLVITANSS